VYLSTVMFLWVAFGSVLVISFLLDVGFCTGKSQGNLSIRQAIVLSLLWVLVALAFNLALYIYYDSQTAIQFLASYLLEKGLSVDNVFVFYIIFESYQIPERHQRRVLQWGIIGALGMRALFIATGIQLLQNFHVVIYFFGGLLVYTGLKLALQQEAENTSEDFGNTWWIKLIQKWIPYVDDFGDGAFFVNVQTNLVPPKYKWYATRLFFALVTVELMDAVFALDSIPAILSLTHDPLVVYTSNIFAILGLRALYFAISGMVNQFHYLKYGLSLILMFVGLKMLISKFYKIPLVVALLFIVVVMVGSVIVSIFVPSAADSHSPANASGNGNGTKKVKGEISAVVINNS